MTPSTAKWRPLGAPKRVEKFRALEHEYRDAFAGWRAAKHRAFRTGILHDAERRYRTARDLLAAFLAAGDGHGVR